MKKLSKHFVCAVLLLFAGALVYTQEQTTDRATVPFSDPSKPGMVKVNVHNGSITVKGYEGKEVIVEAKSRGKTIKSPEMKMAEEISERVRARVATELRERGEEHREEREEEKQRSTEGMRKIAAAGGTGLEIEEADNVMEIDVSSLRQSIDLTIQVPYSTSLELDAHTNGDITVENVTGEIEIDHHNGALKLTGISGVVVANTWNGDVEVSFTSVDPDKPMSFSTWNGDIDVTFPASVKANVRMKSERGEVYSDFDIQVDTTPQKKEVKKEGKYQISFEKYIIGSINGGGPEYHFKTYTGDILIRKAK
jgi:DNA polymerase II small subunit/DNA polymerase delta subunit B